MSKTITKSNTAVILLNTHLSASQQSAFTTSNMPVEPYNLVQDFNYSVQIPRQDLKQVGSQDLASRDFFQQPDVQLGFSYLIEPAFRNEKNSFLIPFDIETSPSEFHNFFNGVLDKSTNFYAVISNEQQGDALDKIAYNDTIFDLTGFDCIAFGNCFPTSYGLTYSLGAMPVASTNFICSNVIFEKLTGKSMQSPAINLTGGNNDNVGLSLFLIEDRPNGFNLVVGPNETGADSAVKLQNLEVGGQALSGIHFVQSLDMSVGLERTSNYGLGNDFAFNRKAQLPANGTFTVSSLVSGLAAGELTGVLNNDDDYTFEVAFTSTTGHKGMIYKVEDAKLNSYNYGMPVNGQMTFDAEFSFKVTETNGLKVSGSQYT